MSEMPSEAQTQVAETLTQPSSFDSFHPAFRSLAEKLKPTEDESAKYWHDICARGQHEDDAHYAYCALHYTRQSYESLNDFGITIRDSDTLQKIYGISLSIADIHFQSGHYDSCISELQRLYAVMSVASHECAPEIQHLIETAYTEQAKQQSHTNGTSEPVWTDVGYNYFPKLPELTLPIIAKRRGFGEDAGLLERRHAIIHDHIHLKALDQDTKMYKEKSREASGRRAVYINSVYMRAKRWVGPDMDRKRHFAQGRDFLLALLYYQIEDADYEKMLQSAVESIKEHDDLLDIDIIERTISYIESDKVYRRKLERTE